MPFNRFEIPIDRGGGSGGEKKKQNGRPERPVAKRNNPADYTTGELMRMTRRELGRSQTESARIMGISSQALSGIELGKIGTSKRTRAAFEKTHELEPGEVSGSDAPRERGRPRKWKRTHI